MVAGGRPGKKPVPVEDRPLPKKHIAFLRHYHMGDQGKPITGKEAAIRAGYPASSAAEQASWILSRENAKRWLAEQGAIVAERHKITLDMIVEELAKVGFSNMADYIQDDGSGKPQFKPIADISRVSMAAVTELTLDVRKEFEGRGEDREHVANVEKVRFKLASKVEGLVNLGRLLGHFPRGGGDGDDGPEGGTKKVIIEVRGGLPKRKKPDGKSSG